MMTSQRISAGGIEGQADIYTSRTSPPYRLRTSPAISVPHASKLPSPTSLSPPFHLYVYLLPMHLPLQTHLTPLSTPHTTYPPHKSTQNGSPRHDAPAPPRQAQEELAGKECRRNARLLHRVRHRYGIDQPGCVPEDSGEEGGKGEVAWVDVLTRRKDGVRRDKAGETRIEEAEEGEGEERAGGEGEKIPSSAVFLDSDFWSWLLLRNLASIASSPFDTWAHSLLFDLTRQKTFNLEYSNTILLPGYSLALLPTMSPFLLCHNPQAPSPITIINFLFPPPLISSYASTAPSSPTLTNPSVFGALNFPLPIHPANCPIIFPVSSAP